MHIWFFTKHFSVPSRLIMVTSFRSKWAGWGSGSARRRIGVWGSKTAASRHGYNDQEVSAELMMLCKRRHADTPIRRYVSPVRRGAPTERAKVKIAEANGKGPQHRKRRTARRPEVLYPSFPRPCAGVYDLWMCHAGRAGARPYVRLRVRTNSGVEVPIGQNTGCP
jgi:hypothetical protein